MPDPLAVLVLTLTACVLAFLVPFALHRAWLPVESQRARREDRPGIQVLDAADDETAWIVEWRVAWWRARERLR